MKLGVPVSAALAAAVPALAIDKTQIDIRVREVGTLPLVDNLTIVHPDLTPAVVEVFVWYNREAGIGLATSVHNVIGWPYDPSAGDAVTLLDRPDSVLHPDGRYGTFNKGGQAQAVYHTGTSGVDANRFRIGALGNPNNLPAGGISVHQDTPVALGWTFNFDKVDIPGFHFLLTVGCGHADAPRSITIDAPRSGVNSYAVYADSSGSIASVLHTLLDSDPATVTVVAPAPASVLIVGAACAVPLRRRRGADRFHAAMDLGPVSHRQEGGS